MIEQPYVVLLAAGQGRRLATVTGGIPKQFWRGQRGSSLLDDTLARFAPVAPLSRTVLIVDRRHRALVEKHDVARSSAIVIDQPEDRGTAAGVLLGLTPVLAADPHALVVITPSDHGVVDQERFLQGIRDAARHAVRQSAVVLFGAEPTTANPDYGWIVADQSLTVSPVRAVRIFVEKPSADIARRLMADGAVWNTMVLVAPADLLWNLCFSVVPQVAKVFEAAMALPAHARGEFLNEVYATLPAFDFSRHVLASASNLWTYVWPATIGWSDLGTPERLAAWHQGTCAGTEMALA